MQLYQPTITGSLLVSGSIVATGGITVSGSIDSASYAATASFVTLSQTASFVTTAQTASFVANAQSASNAVTAQTASYANALTVAGTLTAQTLVVQTITSSVDFVTGSTRFGSLSSNTHTFTGSVLISGSTVIGNRLNPAASYSLEIYANDARAVVQDNANGTAGFFMRVVSGSTQVGSATVRTDNTGTFTIFSGTSSESARIIINSVGAVGIGVTPTSGWGSSTKVVQIGSGSLYNDSFNNTLIVTNAYFNGSDNIHIATGPALRYYQEISNGEHYFQVAPSKVSGSSVAYTSSLYIKNNGNIGVNHTSPTAKFHVVGGNEVGIRSIVGGTYAPFQFSGDNNVTSGSINAYNGIVAIGRSTSDLTGVNPDIAINSSGNVGIGITNPGVKLYVSSSSADYATIIKNTNTSGYGLQVLTAGSSTNLAFQVRTNNTSTNAFQVLDNGNIGVGTTSPTAKLEIFDNTNSGIIRLSRDIGNARGQVQFGRNNGGSFQECGSIIVDSDTASVNNGVMYFYTSNSSGTNTERMRITSTGVLELALGQIKFPSSQQGSANVNTLDDYEEGTIDITTLTDGVATFTQQEGYKQLSYTKIGDKVFVNGNIYNASISGTWTNPLRIPLPYTSGTGGQSGRSRSAGHAALYNWGTSDNIYKIENGGATYAELVSAGNGGAWGTLTTSAGFTAIVSFFYTTAT